MKKIASIVLLVLALHAVALAAGVGYLLGTGKLNKTSAVQIKEALFPQPSTQPSTTQPSEEAAAKGDSPMIRLEDLLARQANRSATEQVEFVRAQFDEQLSQLDRRYRDLKALEAQVDAGRSDLERERKAVEKREATMTARETDAAKKEQDEGFASEIALYTAMPAAQVKGVFMGMEDAEAAKYVKALPVAAAKKVLREFKSPEEKSRMNAILAMIRKGEIAGSDTAAASGVNGANGASGATGASGAGKGAAGEPTAMKTGPVAGPIAGATDGGTGSAEREPAANQRVN